MISIEGIKDISIKRIICSRKELWANTDCTSEVLKELKDDDFSISQYLLGSLFYLNRIKAIFPNGGTVADIGAGCGNWSIAAAQHFNKVIAIEKDIERTNKAIKIAKIKNLTNISFINASADQLGSIQSSSVDSLICYNAITFFDIKHKDFFCEANRILKQDGILYLATTDIGFLFWLGLQSVENKSIEKAKVWVKVLIKNLLYVLGVKKQPTSWMNSRYVFKLLDEKQWRLLCHGYEGKCSQTPNLFPKKFLKMPYMKEYIIKKI